MVKSLTGTLITCDPAAKQLILFWNESKPEKFVLKDVDERRVLVRSDAVERIRQMFHELNDELNFDPPLEDADED